MNHAPVLFKNGGTIERISRERFAELAEAGAVSLETPVFNNTLTRVGDLRPARRWARCIGGVEYSRSPLTLPDPGP